MATEEKERMVLAGLDIPFWDLVWFMVKLTLASIPAIVILSFTFFLIAMLFGWMGAMVPPAVPGSL